MFDKKQNRREYYLKNKESEKASALKYYQENKSKCSEVHKEWLEKNRDINNQKRRDKYKNNFDHRLKSLLRARYLKALKRGSKLSSCLKYLGCSIDDFKAHIESLFKKDMSWDNWSYRGWHLDHIIPISYFDLTKEEDKVKAFNYKNMQPLWGKENMLKSAKYETTTT